MHVFHISSTSCTLKGFLFVTDQYSIGFVFSIWKKEVLFCFRLLNELKQQHQQQHQIRMKISTIQQKIKRVTKYKYTKQKQHESKAHIACDHKLYILCVFVLLHHHHCLFVGWFCWLLLLFLSLSMPCVRKLFMRRSECLNTSHCRSWICGAVTFHIQSFYMWFLISNLSSSLSLSLSLSFSLGRLHYHDRGNTIFLEYRIYNIHNTGVDTISYTQYSQQLHQQAWNYSLYYLLFINYSNLIISILKFTK